MRIFSSMRSKPPVTFVVSARAMVSWICRSEPLVHRVVIEVAERLRSRLLHANLLFHALEAARDVRGVGSRHGLVDLLLGLGAAAAGDEQVLLRPRLLALGLQLVQRVLELLDLLGLLLVLLLEAGGRLLEGVAAGQRLLRQIVLALLDR